eukprot:753161-Hanusia_phi.AAC.4
MVAQTVKGGKVLSLSSLMGRGFVGTSVVCRDLFYNRPVARKIISRQVADLHTSKSRRVVMIESLSSLVRSSTVVHPSISFSLHFSPSLQPDLEFPRSRDLLQCFQRVGKKISVSELYKFETKKTNFSVDVVLGSPWMNSPPRSKEFQLVFFNRRLASRNPVHKHINQLYKTSWGSLEPVAALENKHVREFFKHFPQRKRRRVEDNSAVAPCKRYPVFVVDIRCSPLSCSFAECDSGAFVEFAHWEEVFACLDGLFKLLCEKAKTADEEAGLISMHENLACNRSCAAPPSEKEGAEDVMMKRSEARYASTD